MSYLTKQSIKARQIQSVICLADGIGHRTVTSCHSQSEPLNYEQVIQPVGVEIIDGHKVVIYHVTCPAQTPKWLDVNRSEILEDL